MQRREDIIVAAACADKQNRHVVAPANLLAELKAGAAAQIDIQKKQRDLMMLQKRLCFLIAVDVCCTDVEDIEVFRGILGDCDVIVDHQALIVHAHSPCGQFCCKPTVLPVSPMNTTFPFAGSGIFSP